MIALTFDLAQGGFGLSVDLRVDGRVVALVGPSGSGKTTVLEAIAGLRTPRAGRIAIGDRVLFSSADRIDLPARARHVGYVPQDGMLFPHMSVRRNVLYGAPRQRGGVEGPSLDRVLAMLEIAPLIDRPVAGLSGGERQRVAVARALMSAPALLLLDEPLAAVDVPLRRRIVPSLERVRDELQVPMLYVTHDREEADALADWTITLDAGTRRRLRARRAGFRDKIAAHMRGWRPKGLLAPRARRPVRRRRPGARPRAVRRRRAVGAEAVRHQHHRPAHLPRDRGAPARGARAENRRPDGRRGVEAGAAGGAFHPARAAFRRAGHRAHRIPHPLQRPDAVLRHLGVRGQSGRHHRERDEARFRPEQGRRDQDRPRHLPRSPERVLLQHQPARRGEGRQLGRERPHHQLRLERGVGGAHQPRRARAGTPSSRCRSASSGSRARPPRSSGG